MSPPKIFLLVFLFAFIFFTAFLISDFLTAAMTFSCLFFPTKFVSFVFNHSL